MHDASFQVFCDQVCRQVRFTPDHPAIRAELLSHLEDRADALAAQGMPLRTAAEAAVAAMGDPAEIGRGLDRQHAYWLGWVQRVVHRVCLAALVLAVLTALYIGDGLLTQPTRWYSPEYQDRRIQLWTSAQEARVRAGDYALTLDGVRTYGYAGGDERYLGFTLTVTHLDPRLEGPEFLRALSAEDDLGTRYLSDEERAALDGPPSPDCFAAFDRDSRGPHRSVYEGTVGPLTPGALRVTLVYDRAGQQFRIPIALDGGEAA